MEYILFAIKLIAYLVLIWITYFITVENKDEILCNNTINSKYNVTCISKIFVIATATSIYSFICSADPYAADRDNYDYYFSNGITGSMTPALNGIAEFVHLLTYDSDVFFYVVSFITVAVFYLGYSLYEKIDEKAVILIGCSQCYIYSFYLLKQAPAIAFASLFLFSALKKENMLSVISIIFAILFHESAIILIPIWILFRFAEIKWVRGIVYCAAIILVVGFAPLTGIMVSIIEGIIPALYNQIQGYVNESGNLAQGLYLMTIIKGAPYYLICFYAIIKRRKMHTLIDNYDRFLLISVFAACATALSGYMYWMWRFGAFFYFPTLIFASKIINCIDNKLEKVCTYTGLSFVLLFFTFRYLYQIYFLYGGF